MSIRTCYPPRRYLSFSAHGRATNSLRDKSQTLLTPQRASLG